MLWILLFTSSVSGHEKLPVDGHGIARGHKCRPSMGNSQWPLTQFYNHGAGPRRFRGFLVVFEQSSLQLFRWPQLPNDWQCNDQRAQTGH